nr:phage tail tube protein [Bradyrhizobium cosmicum]QDP27014.1 hypothetical protein FNV92_34890 [Bradyrhizobium cosmicum]
MADLQSTNRVALAKVREATFGVIPANPAFKAVRQTSSSLAANPQTKISAEIRGDRQVTDLILVGEDATANVGGELAFGVADDDFEEALQGTWSNSPSITVVTADTEISDVAATTLTVSAGGAQFVAGMLTLTQNLPTAANNKLAKVVSSTGTSIVYPAATYSADAVIPVGASVRQVGFEGASGDITAVTAGGNGLACTAADFTTFGMVPGEWVKVGDGDNANCSFAGTAANNDFCRIASVAAKKVTFDRVPAGWAADTGTGKTIRVFTGDFLTNASTKRSNTIERQYLDHSPVTYEYLRGMTLNTLAIRGQAAGHRDLHQELYRPRRLSARRRWRGIRRDRCRRAELWRAQHLDQCRPSRLRWLGHHGANFVMQATININNNLRAQKAIGSIGAVGIGNGEFNVSGSLQTYFGDPSIYQKIVNNTLTSYDQRVGRSDGNRETIVMDLPAIKMSGGSPSVSGKNQDVMIDAPFTAIRHATLGYTMSVGRFWYLPTS